jgi:hypothetical protein
MGQCFTTTIEETDPVAFAEHGALFRAMSQEWESGAETHGRKRFNGTTAVYVFCSKRVPAVLYGDRKGFRATFLAPDKEDDYVHSTEPSYWIYFAVCHGKRFGPSGQPSRVARALGYRVEPSEEQPILRRPEDILTYDPPGRGRGR